MAGPVAFAQGLKYHLHIVGFVRWGDSSAKSTSCIGKQLFNLASMRSR